MGFRAVALSQVYGSGAESIGRDVARQLGFGYLNEAIVAQVAGDLGVDPASVSEAERRKSFLARLAEMAALGAPDVLPDTSLYDETDTLMQMRVGGYARGSPRRLDHLPRSISASRTRLGDRPPCRI